MFLLLGFSFIDPSLKVKPKLIIELNGTTNYSISCRTTDPNAITTLFHNSKEIPVGGRVTLDKQVYTIHNILMSDQGIYTCKARNGLGAVIEKKAALILTIVKGTKFINIVMTQNLYSYSCRIEIFF